MNNIQNEKQLMPLKKMFGYTLVIGAGLMVIAFLAGVFTFDLDGKDSLPDETVSNEMVE